MPASERDHLVLGELRKPRRAGGRQLRAAGSLLARLLTLALFPQQDSLAVTGSRASHLRCVAAEERAGLRPPRAAVRARLSQPTTLSSCGALAPAFSLTCSSFALLLSLPLHLGRCVAVARTSLLAAFRSRSLHLSTSRRFLTLSRLDEERARRRATLQENARQARGELHKWDAREGEGLSSGEEGRGGGTRSCSCEVERA